LELTAALELVARGIKTKAIPNASLIPPLHGRSSVDIVPLSSVIAKALASAKESEGT
jgi:hypothetical protein